MIIEEIDFARVSWPEMTSKLLDQMLESKKDETVIAEIIKNKKRHN